jgi:hypothetical protein
MTTIETRFLADAEIKTTLQMTEVNTTLRAIARVEEKNITEKVRLGKLMIPAHEVFKSADFKAKMENEGISWNLDQFSKAVFGKGKSQFYKYIQCAKAVLETPNLIKVYTDLVKSTLAEDNDIEKIEVGMDSFNYYVKHGELEEVVKARQSEESSEDESDIQVGFDEETSAAIDDVLSDSNCEWTMAETNGASARKVDGAIIYDENNYSKADILASIQKMFDDVLNS